MKQNKEITAEHNGPLGPPFAFSSVAALAVRSRLDVNSLGPEETSLAINNYVMTRLIKQWGFITIADF